MAPKRAGNYSWHFIFAQACQIIVLAVEEPYSLALESPPPKSGLLITAISKKPGVKRMSSMMQRLEFTRCLLPVFICSNLRSASRLKVALRDEVELGQEQLVGQPQEGGRASPALSEWAPPLKSKLISTTSLLSQLSGNLDTSGIFPSFGQMCHSPMLLRQMEKS